MGGAWNAPYGTACRIALCAASGPMTWHQTTADSDSRSPERIPRPDRQIQRCSKLRVDRHDETAYSITMTRTRTILRPPRPSFLIYYYFLTIQGRAFDWTGRAGIFHRSNFRISAPPRAAFFAKYFVSKAVNIGTGVVNRIQSKSLPAFQSAGLAAAGGSPPTLPSARTA